MRLPDAPVPPAGARGHHPELDGLRGLAALLIVLTHLAGIIAQVHFGPGWLWAGAGASIFRYGNAGVYLFFVLSGYLLVEPWAAALRRGASEGPSLWRYWSHRFARILPAYYVCLAVLAFTQLRAGGGVSMTDIVLHMAFLFNVSMSTYYSFLVPFWTLAVEWQFYVMLPLLGWLMLRLTRSSVAAAISVAVIALACLAGGRLVSSFLFHRRLGLDHLVALYPLAYLSTFACGMVARLVQDLPAHLRPWRFWPWLTVLLVLPPLASLATGASVTNRWLSPNAIYPAILSPVVYGLGFSGLLAAGLRLSPLRRVFGAGWSSYLGRISYGMYLWNAPVLGAVLVFAQPRARAAAVGGCILVALLAVAAVAAISHHVIELPFMKLAHRGPRVANGGVVG